MQLTVGNSSLCTVTVEVGSLNATDWLLDCGWTDFIGIEITGRANATRGVLNTLPRGADSFLRFEVQPIFSQRYWTR